MIVVALVLCCLVLASDARVGISLKSLSKPSQSELRSSSSFKDVSSSISSSSSGSSLLSIRGGEVISGKKVYPLQRLQNSLHDLNTHTSSSITSTWIRTQKKSTLKKGKEILNQIKPATRAYFLLCVACSLVEMLGLPAPKLFAIDPRRVRYNTTQRHESHYITQ
jgi:hypothetical protein